MREEKATLIIRPAGDKFQVREDTTGLIWRTLDSRPEAEAWARAATPEDKSKK